MLLRQPPTTTTTPQSGLVVCVLTFPVNFVSKSFENILIFGRTEKLVEKKIITTRSFVAVEGLGLFEYRKII